MSSRSCIKRKISTLLQYFISLTYTTVKSMFVCVPFCFRYVTAVPCYWYDTSDTERQDKESLFNTVLERGKRRGSQTRIFEVKACRGKIRQHKKRNRLMLAKGVKIIRIFLQHHKGKYWKD